MQFASEQHAEWKGIKFDAVLSGNPAYSGVREMPVPLISSLIIIRQDNSMRAVAHPVHELQNLEIEPVLGQMILDEYVTPADAACLQK